MTIKTQTSGTPDITDAERGSVEVLEAAREDKRDNSSGRSRLLGVVLLIVAITAVIAIPTAIFKSSDSDDPVTKPPNDTAAETQSVYSWEGLAFNVSFPLFSAEMTHVYSNEQELRDGLVDLSKFYVNALLERNLNQQHRYPQPGAGGADDAEGDAGPPVASPQTPSAKGATDYETNTQEEDVNEGDLVKSDGRFVYAAYGDTVIVWDAFSGAWVANETLPLIEYKNEDGQEKPPPGETPETSGGTRKTSVPPDHYYGPSIQSLLLYSNKLVVVASGYGPSQRQALEHKSAFADVLSTNLRIYETSVSGKLLFFKERHVNGYFSEARYIDHYAHLVTYASLNYYLFFDHPLARYKFDGTDEEYVQAAKTMSEEELIPAFVDAIMKDFEVNDPELPLISHISLWQSTVSTNGAFESQFFEGGIANVFTGVVSIDITDQSNRLGISLSGTFMPAGWGYTYATSEMIVLVGQGWDYVPELEGTTQTTYLLCSILQNASSMPAAVGMFPGYVINQFALDIVDKHMRVATTINFLWPFHNDDSDIGEYVEPIQLAQNQLLILEIPAMDGVEPAVLSEVGRIPDLGHEREVFTAVRFFDNIAYAVTYEQKDPIYALDLSDVNNPIILGELNVTGFSTYLHSINEDDTLLLAVGEEADLNGNILGVQLSLFDARIPQDLRLLQRLVVEDSDKQWSSSSVAWDHKGFRYLPLDITDPDSGTIINQGIAIIPLTIYGRPEFDGFVAYSITLGGIRERFNISHIDAADIRRGCFPPHNLAERSLVFNGSVTTLKRHSVRHSNLDTGFLNWDINLWGGEYDVCGGYYD